MAVAFMAANNRFRNIVITDGGSISSDNGTFTTNGAGVLTCTGAINSGNLSVATQNFLTTGATVQTVATGNTITITAGTTIQKVTTAGAVTGVIVTAGTVDGQKLIIINTSANTVTFAASGTSNVAGGAAVAIAAFRQITFYWNTTTSLWY